VELACSHHEINIFIVKHNTSSKCTQINGEMSESEASALINSQMNQKSVCTHRTRLIWIVNLRLPCAQKRWKTRHLLQPFTHL